MFDIKKNLGSLLFAGIIGSKKSSIVSLDMRYRKYEIFISVLGWYQLEVYKAVLFQ